MKKSIVIALVSLTAALSAFGQGSVNFRNDYHTGNGTGPFAYINGADGAPLAKGVGRVEILDSNGTTVLSTSVDGTGKAFIDNGLFLGGSLTVTGTTATIRAWDNSTGATYDLATSKGSQLVNLTSFGGGTTPPVALGVSSVPQFAGFTLSGPVIPEPSTVALAGLGIVGLLVVARRK